MNFTVIQDFSEAATARDRGRAAKGNFKKAYRDRRQGKFHHGTAGAAYANAASRAYNSKRGSSVASTARGIQFSWLKTAGEERKKGRKNAARLYMRMAKD